MASNVWFRAEDNRESLDAAGEADSDIVCLKELTPKFVSAQVIRRGNSDHYPVYAIFSLE